VGVVQRLVAEADVFIEGMRPGVAERLGLGPEELLRLRPRLIYGRMTGWGQEGPQSLQAGHDIDYLAASGVLAAIGSRDRPAVPANLLGDYAGGSLYLVIGVLAALHEVRTSGLGQVVDAAIIDGVSHLSTALHGLVAAGMWSDRRGDNLLDGGTPFYDVYETSDGEFMAVGPLEPKFYAEFVRLLGVEQPLPERTEVEDWQRLRELISDRFAECSQAEWASVFAGSDACVEPVTPLSRAAAHPHLAVRQTFVGHDGVVQPAPAPRFSRTPTHLTSGPSKPGLNSREALLAWGITDVDELIADGVVQQADEEQP
jgi:alpha-methylacyl-CoA racemase